MKLDADSRMGDNNSEITSLNNRNYIKQENAKYSFKKNNANLDKDAISSIRTES
jgi:hypothetical protein